MKTQPSFSIVIPTYGRRDVVCEMVRSLSELSYEGDFNVVVVVDGSRDGSAAALADLECPFPLSVIEQPNQGAAHARNRGAAAATGEILLFLDDDMVCAPNLLEQHARLYREGADAITGEITPHHALPDGLRANDLPKFAPSDGNAPASAFDIFTGQLSVKRQVFEELGGFDESFTASGGYGNEDLDFGARLLARYSVRINPAAITMHRDGVNPRRVLQRARLLATADVRFASKHPELAHELFDRRGASERTTRLLYRPIGRVPLLAPLVASVAVRIADLTLKTRLGGKRTPSRLFSIAYGTSYWSSVSRAFRLLGSKEVQ